MLLIPSGLVWRRYLSLWIDLVEDGIFGNDDDFDDKETNVYKLVFLESAAELMDWRNNSSSLSAPAHNREWNNDDEEEDSSDRFGIPEASALHERSRIRKLIQTNPNIVHVFCDLSVIMEQEDDEDDEFKEWNYQDMSVSDRSFHALFRAGRMLDISSAYEAVLIVDESEKQRLGHEDGPRLLTMQDLTNEIIRHSNSNLDDMQAVWLTKLEQNEQEYIRRNASPASSVKNQASSTANWRTLTPEEIDAGLQDGRFVRGGRLEVSEWNRLEAYCTIKRGVTLLSGNNSNKTSKVFVPYTTPEFHGYALHHDAVVLQLLPEGEWKRPVGRRRLVHHRDDDNNNDNNASDETTIAEGPSVPTARVVGILESSRHVYVATLVDPPSSESDRASVLVVPMDRRIPKIRIVTKAWQRYINQRLLVQVDGWDPETNNKSNDAGSYPQGHVVEILGEIGQLETEITCLLETYNVRLQTFSANALASLPLEGAEWKVSQNQLLSGERRDLRKSRRIFSVDPPGCQDIDDTMHAQVLPNGDIEVGVHIADVTHFVPHESALDFEAQKRGTTFYLVDRRFDMLPTLLSSNLCSLHGNMDRLAVSVIWTFSSDLKMVKNVWYGRSVIHNCAAMTYEQAHNILHDIPFPKDAPVPPPLTAGAPVNPALLPQLKRDLSILTRLTRKLRKEREDVGGAVDLTSSDVGSELKFVLDENGNPVQVSSKKEMEIHHTIAEMMIMANQSVARKIFDAFPQEALLRVHRTVEEDRFEGLETAMKAGGIEFDGSSNAALAKTLYQARQRQQQEHKGGNTASVVNGLWQSLATRAMSEALYVCTGSHQSDALQHYGLGIQHYTHFTSPIRRYADVVVHKQLLAALEREELTRQKAAIMPPPGFAVKRSKPSVARIIPDSAAISILRGQGLEDDDDDDDLDGDDLLDSLIEGASELTIGDGERPATIPETENEKISLKPYTGSTVDHICHGLNQQNRNAKLSSMQCQKLFLSLYFRQHVETVPAVVTDLRQNGMVVYVPSYDLRGVVYLSDRYGNVQMDPSLVGLPKNAGQPPSAGFASTTSVGKSHNRLFPTATTRLVTSDDYQGNTKTKTAVARSTLSVVFPEGQSISFQTLDVVNVTISCDFSDIKARVPSPRLQLVAATAVTTNPKGTTDPVLVTTDHLQAPTENVAKKSKSQWKDRMRKADSVFEVLMDITSNIRPVLENVPIRRRQHLPRQKATKIDTSKRKEQQQEHKAARTGRRSFGGFVNPDTRAAKQEHSAAEARRNAALQRSTSASTESATSSYNRTRQIEREATARMQRIAAEKRNSRRSKASK